MEEGVLSAMRSVRTWFVGLSIGLLILASQTAAWAGSVEHTYVAFFDYTSPSGYRGAEASWDDASWTGISCPVDISQVPRVNTFINLFGQSPSQWIQLGAQKGREYTNQCVTYYSYYWEWSSPDGYNTGYITNPSPRGSHQFDINRLTTGCSPRHLVLPLQDRWRGQAHMLLHA